jgi:hypothetical protein
MDLDPPSKPRPGNAGSRGFSKDSEPPEYEDEDEELRKMDWRVRAYRQDSITRRHITLYYVIALVWLVFLLHDAWIGESYTRMRNGGAAYATGAGLWVQCLAPVFIVAGLFLRFDQASLDVSNRRWWGGGFGILGVTTYIVSPYWFGTVTFLH